MPDRRALLGGSFLALAAASLFATLGPLSRFAGEAGLGSTAFVAWRAGIGAVALAALLVLTGGLTGAAASLVDSTAVGGRRSPWLRRWPSRSTSASSSPSSG